ncbi:NTF2 and RRM domain-containing protein [Colletotrichum kahawae]|uniref:NTF2 and RRM domain-containing protein n=1 Tax=Colletotrichum kahawae TaxID=34407 RepID=A0AAD9Y1Q7_COLKA|nr:NTF2 and RRM domain-containing protein [Colletotrichum kahawae]
MATNGNYTYLDQFKDAVEQTSPGPTATNDAAASAGNNNNLSKDEVGWYFVEQYYTTLSKNPDKLHLFYGKRSQFVYGMEAEVANVSVGRQAIQERIKSLDFQNSKVRITNVDSQASFDNIVIQVIGESSIKSAEPKKFVQTFVLAPQPSGYFVVNDILRYINDEDEEEAVAEAEVQPEEQAATEEVVEAAKPEEPVVEQTPEEAPAPAIDPSVVDKRLEEVAVPQDAASSNGDAEAPAPEPVKAPETKVEEPTVDPEVTAKEIAEEDIKMPEKPADPSPTPVAAPTKPPAAEPEKPAPAPAPVPMKPMSWASRAAAAVGPKAAVPLPKTATPPAPAQAKAPAPATAPAAAAAAAAPATKEPAAAPAAKEPEAPAAKESSPAAEWQSVGADSKRQNRPQSISQAPADNGTLGYVKYVTDKVKAEDLRAALNNHGELTYFDINRQKNCAFVEFATPAGYQAAAAANPHIVNGENIVVEPRRPKATAYGGANYSAGGRGNATGGRGRGGFEGNRSGSQGNARGNFTGGQARGRGSVRGRGASQATA